MIIHFSKMHGAGNDFIVVDDRESIFPLDDLAFIREVTSRRTGIGCDGILLAQSSSEADVRMRFVNPDGGEQDMCGNGARCLARFAFDRGMAPAEMTMETGAGVVEASVLGEGVRIALTEPNDLRLDLPLDEEETVDFVNTGVEHAVVWVDDPAEVDVDARGKEIREHAAFAPKGANANFARIEPDGSIRSRTYERGVEAETLACGTGAAAVAAIAVERGWANSPVTVHCAGGFDLVIESLPRAIRLTGGAEYVFEGEVEYGNRL